MADSGAYLLCGGMRGHTQQILRKKRAVARHANGGRSDVSPA